MAEIFLCSAQGPEGFSKDVVIKRIRPFLADDPAFVQMFVAEARLASRLEHPNIVQIFDFDRHADTYYLAMEWVRGASLSEVRRRCRELGRPFPPLLAAHVGAQVARGLAYAHRLTVRGEPLNVVHRDVTPHNVLLSFEGAVKLGDFGIAHAGQASTAPGLKGKFAYMSPEQSRGEPVDGRCDVFALGVVLWELLTGGRPFEAESDLAVLRAVQQRVIAPPRRLNPEVPEALDRAVMRALERDLQARWGSALELQHALDEVVLRCRTGIAETDVGTFLGEVLDPRAEELSVVLPPAVELSLSSLAPRVAPGMESGSAGPDADEAPSTAPGGPPRAGTDESDDGGRSLDGSGAVGAQAAQSRRRRDDGTPEDLFAPTWLVAHDGVQAPAMGQGAPAAPAAPVKRRPWPLLGGALACGAAVGLLLRAGGAHPPEAVGERASASPGLQRSAGLQDVTAVLPEVPIPRPPSPAAGARMPGAVVQSPLELPADRAARASREGLLIDWTSVALGAEEDRSVRWAQAGGQETWSALPAVGGPVAPAVALTSGADSGAASRRRGRGATEPASSAAGAGRHSGLVVLDVFPVAELRVDGKPRGEVRGRHSLRLSPGVRTIHLIHPNRSATFEVEVKAGATHQVKFNAFRPAS